MSRDFFLHRFVRHIRDNKYQLVSSKLIERMSPLASSQKITVASYIRN
jgi:hypothetical protein